MIPCGIYRGRRKADVLTLRLNDDPGRPENVPDRSQVEANITELDHLVKVNRPPETLLVGV